MKTSIFVSLKTLLNSKLSIIVLNLTKLATSDKSINLEQLMNNYLIKKTLYAYNLLILSLIVTLVFSVIYCILNPESLDFLMLAPFCVTFIAILQLTKTKENLMQKISILFLISHVMTIVYLVPELILESKYSFFFGMASCYAHSFLVDSFKIYKHLIMWGYGLFFCICIYDGSEIGQLIYFLITFAFFCSGLTLDSHIQKEIIDKFIINSKEFSSQLSTKETLEKLLYKPSFILNSCIENECFLSKSFEDTFKPNWLDLLKNTFIAQKIEIDQVANCKLNLTDTQSLHEYLKNNIDTILSSQESVTLIGFIKKQYFKDPNVKVPEVHTQLNVVPFQIKLTNFLVSGKPKLFVEFDNCTSLIEYFSMKSLEKYRDNIVSSVSHDVKTPITSCFNYCSQIKDSRSRYIIRKSVKSIEEKLIKTHFNISIMILNARLLKGNSPANISCFGAHRLMLSLCKMLESEATGKKILLSVVSDQKFIIYNDKEAFLLINYILLTNAITYSHGGTVAVHLKTIFPKEENDIPLLEVIIEDQGVGMDADTVKKIRDRDFFSNNKSHSMQGGFIGINNILNFLELISPHNHKIHVESELGVGTRFSYKVYRRHPGGKYQKNNQSNDNLAEDPSDDEAPYENLFRLKHKKANIKRPSFRKQESELKQNESIEFQNTESDKLSKSLSTQGSGKDKPEQAKAADKNEQVYKESYQILSSLLSTNILEGLYYKIIQKKITKEAYESLKILIVDDNYFNVECLSQILQKLGLFNQEKFISSREALESMRKLPKPFNLVFLDYQMPELTGCELLQAAIKENLLQSDCRNILITAASEISFNHIENDGFHTIVYKPYTIKQIFEEVLSCFDNQLK